MTRQTQEQLIDFIQQELKVEPEAIALAQRSVQFPVQLPVSLWQYGLITLDGVNHIWNWLESRSDTEQFSSGPCA